jgi:hypothetical protein
MQRDQAMNPKAKMISPAKIFHQRVKTFTQLKRRLQQQQ